MNWKDIKSVEEILTKGLGINGRLQIAVRCDEHPNVNGKWLTAADAFKLALGGRVAKSYAGNQVKAQHVLTQKRDGRKLYWRWLGAMRKA